MHGALHEIATFVCCVAMAWSCFGTGVLRADNDPVAQASQADAPTLSARTPDARRWRLPDSERPPPLPGATRPKPDYTAALAGSYLAFPVLVIGGPILVANLTDSGTATFVTLVGGEVVALSLPALVHAFNGDGSRARRALGLNLLSVTLGIIGGAVLGSAFTTSQADSESDGDASITNAAIGGLVGGSVGAVVWALYDVVETSNSVGEREAISARNRTRFAVLPHRSGAFASVSGTF